jgi:hypothetical protein
MSFDKQAHERINTMITPFKAKFHNGPYDGDEREYGHYHSPPFHMELIQFPDAVPVFPESPIPIVASRTIRVLYKLVEYVPSDGFEHYLYIEPGAPDSQDLYERIEEALKNG